MALKQNTKFTLLLIASLCLLFLFKAFYNESHALHKGQGQPFQHQFINSILPDIRVANQEILKQRETVQQYYKIWQKTKRLTNQRQLWLIKLANHYKLTDVDFSEAQDWQALLKRVDVIPAGLVLAQAINESSWGRSRFAKQGNNYFGQWCYTKGCGLVPLKRPKGATYEVKRFASKLASIKSYLLLLNSAQLYTHLRNLRWQLRQAQQTVTGIALAAGLERYSSKGKTYVRLIRNIIRHYHLDMVSAD